ncbi:MAG: glycosyltransferase [Chloroflexaceae bacterium]|nr:glycosyltransferase [Chloroflexaceae bacterium]
MPGTASARLKIVYCIDHLNPEGTQRVLEQLVEGLAQRGHYQAVICLNDKWDEPLRQRLGQSGAEVRIIGKAGLLTGTGLLSTWLWLRHRRFDIGVTLLFVSDVLGRTLLHNAGLPHLISSLRARNVNYAGWQRWLVRFTMRWVDAVVLNSAAVRDFAITHEAAPADRLTVIPNGLRVADYAPTMDAAALRSLFDIPPDAQVIGAVGRLTYQKGFDIALQALAQLNRPHVHVLLLGSGEAEPALRQLAHQLGVAQQVCFGGYRRDIAQLLGALDLYVHPARFEGMPNALLEAMAAGCPIVASAVDGNRELIADGVHGWLVPAEDASALAQALAAALDEPAEARRRGLAAQCRASRDFDVECMIAAWESILLQTRRLGVEH